MVQSNDDEPDQDEAGDHQHENLVRRRLILLHRRVHAFSEERRVDFEQPEACRDPEPADGCEKHPRRRPAQRPGRGEQQRAHADDPKDILN